MARAYALALGAGTQALTLGIGNAVFGTSELNTALMLGAGWAINLAVVEYIIRFRFPASVRARTQSGPRLLSAVTRSGSFGGVPTVEATSEQARQPRPYLYVTLGRAWTQTGTIRFGSPTRDGLNHQPHP